MACKRADSTLTRQRLPAGRELISSLKRGVRFFNVCGKGNGSTWKQKAAESLIFLTWISLVRALLKLGWWI